ncbi:MAG: hypothetical protein SVY15_00335 [Halobacteriota archaeon]|nr:hypothetical protein [Halobacteriota archaeon]
MPDKVGGYRMDDMMRMIRELMTLFEKASDEDISKLNEKLEDIKNDLGDCFIEGWELYKVS